MKISWRREKRKLEYKDENMPEKTKERIGRNYNEQLNDKNKNQKENEIKGKPNQGKED